ncbi:insulinase family protein [Helicobacter mehlei]|uniref:Insulinase family protein n=2 Tax=Helicobacter mehlei TaxID=2316080 RepID=A0A553V0N1_9HELI|nr:pitrilysin family protein [Helicobacter mehlei]TSA86024.1 insulinase family protein [Helicobacter mehlei]
MGRIRRGLRTFLGQVLTLALAGVIMRAEAIQKQEHHTYLPSHYTTILDNGLQVVAVPLKNKSGVIEVNVLYKVGSRNERMGKSGIAHMLEHMNFKSTKHLKEGEFDAIVKSFGGVSNASTSFDYTRYFIKASNENLEKSLELFADMMGSLQLKEDEFLPERQVVAEERLWRTDNSPLGYLYFRFFNTAFVYHPYHWTPIGFMEDIKNWNIEDIRAFHSLYYQPKNAILLVVGDLDYKQVFDQAKKYFGPIKNKTTTTIPKVYTQEPIQNGLRETVIHKKDLSLEWIALGWKVPPFLHKDQVALNALAKLLSEGDSSLLKKGLVDQKRLASQVFAQNMELKDASVFLFVAGANQHVEASQIRKEILAIIDNIKKGGITQQQLDKVKVNNRADFIASLEDSSDVAEMFAEYLTQGDIKDMAQYQEEFNALEIKDIVRVANEYFRDEAYSVVTLKP